MPGITKVLMQFHETIADLQRRFLRVIAEGIGCHESFFDEMVSDGPTLTRAIRYPPMGEVPDGRPHVWAAEHGDINLITALPRATAPGLQVKVDGDWVDAVAPEGQVIINTGIMLERLTNGQIPIGWHRVVAAPGFAGERYSVVQFCHPAAVDGAVAGAELLHPGAPAALPCPQRRRRPRRGALPDQPRRRRPTPDLVRHRGVVADDDDQGAFFDEPTGQLGPPKPLAPAVLAVDISASKFSAGLVTTKGELADRSIALVDPDVGPEAHFRRLTTIVEQQMELADRHELRVAAVGIGCAGPIGAELRHRVARRHRVVARVPPA